MEKNILVSLPIQEGSFSNFLPAFWGFTKFLKQPEVRSDCFREATTKRELQRLHISPSSYTPNFPTRVGGQA